MDQPLYVRMINSLYSNYFVTNDENKIISNKKNIKKQPILLQKSSTIVKNLTNVDKDDLHDENKKTFDLPEQQVLKKENISSPRLKETRFTQNKNMVNIKILPELTDEIKLISNLSKLPNNFMVEAFGLRIEKQDLETLEGLTWLNDEVINFYMNLLIDRSKNKNYPTIHAFNTFFYENLYIKKGEYDYNSVKSWTVRKNIDIFTKDLIIVPIHLGIHWSLAVIDFRDRTIKYYDSLQWNENNCLINLKNYLKNEYRDKKKKNLDLSDWSLSSSRNIPTQKNSSDCGVFLLVFAEYICANKVFSFSQRDMPYFRKKIIYEIITKQLL